MRLILLSLLLPLLPLRGAAQCILKLAPERSGITDWLVEDTVTHQLKGIGAYQWTNPPPSTPFEPPTGRPMSPADVRGLHRAVAAETGLTEAQVAALPRRPLTVVTTPERAWSELTEKEKIGLRKWAARTGADTTKVKVGESHELK